MNSLLQETLLSTKHISTALLLTRSPPHTQKAKSPASATLFTNDQETERIIAGFENPAEVRNQGIMVGGKHYIVIRADGGAVYAKNEYEGGIIAVRSEDYIVIAQYDASMFASVAVEAVERLVEYFRKKGK